LRNKILVTVFVLALFVGVASNFVVATNNHSGPPPIPGSSGGSSGGGGGGGGGGSSGSSGYTGPQINYPITAAVKDSNGNVIGNVTSLSVSQTVFLVSQTLTFNGQPVNVQMKGDLSGAPSNPGMDIISEPTNGTDLPGCLTIGQILACINVTSLNGGWSVNHDTDQITLTVPKELIGSGNASNNVLVRYDGTVYELLLTTVSGPDSNGNYTFTAISPNEGFSGQSEYTLGLVAPPQPTPTATPVPTPMPTTIPTTTAQPAQAPVDGLTIVLSIILVAVIVAVAFMAYFMMIRPR
jgi:hypothetical protein